jgi:flagellar basal-body rod protein FlgC
MAFDDTLSALNISASGLSAERLRMEVVANNIANAFSTRTPQGGAYRRREPVFTAVLDERLRHGAVRGADQLGGVAVEGIVEDQTDLPRVFNPGHPDADRNGLVTLPNVSLPLELVNLLTANRAYEANLRVAQAFRQQAEQALLLLRT